MIGGPGGPPHQLFLAGAAVQLQHLNQIFCTDPAACLGDAPRIWVVVSGDTQNTYDEVTADQAAVLQANYRVSRRQHVSGLTVFLLVKTDQRPQHAPRRPVRQEEPASWREMALDTRLGDSPSRCCRRGSSAQAGEKANRGIAGTS